MVDGDEVLGTRRHVFTAAGDFAGGVAYQLVDLKIYADGAIDCPGDGLMTYDEFRDKVRAGRVATQFEEGAWASGHALARWTFTNVKSEATADDLLGEVADIIDQLNGLRNSGADIPKHRSPADVYLRTILRKTVLGGRRRPYLPASHPPLQAKTEGQD